MIRFVQNLPLGRSNTLLLRPPLASLSQTKLDKLQGQSSCAGIMRSSSSFLSSSNDLSGSPAMEQQFKASFFDSMDKNPLRRGNEVYAASFAKHFSDFANATSAGGGSLITPWMEQQLNHVTEHRSQYSDEFAKLQKMQLGYRLPRTLTEALHQDSNQAIVVTDIKEPFNIVAVNAAWEKLCGYTEGECVGKTLGILQGAETNKAAITALLSQLMRGEEAGTVLVNYTKSGRKFYNRLQVGPLVERKAAKKSSMKRNSNYFGPGPINDARYILEQQQEVITHFVGVLTEVPYTPSQRIMM